MKKSILLLLVLVFFLSACSVKEEDKSSVESQHDSALSSYVVKDIKGREVKFNKVPERVITLGHGALKYYTYVSGPEALVGIEEADKAPQAVNGQSIYHAYEHIKDIETVGKGGPKISPNYEKLAYGKADVIFASYECTKEEMDQLQEKAQIPVVAIGTMMKGDIFTEEAYQTFEIIGKTMHKEERAEALIHKMKEVEKDLRSRSERVDQDLAPEVYLGATNFRGPQGILSTKTHLDLLDVIQVKNIMETYSDERSIMIDKEKLLAINPELIFLDMSGKNPLMEDIQRDPAFYQSLRAFERGQVFALMPYFTYGMNFDTALINMYYIGKVVYPEQYQDVDLEAKAKEIYQTFVGQDVYESMRQSHPESFEEFKINESFTRSLH